MIILLDMTQNWNDDWVSKEDERCVSCYALLPICVAFTCLACHLSCSSNLTCYFRFLYALLAVTVGAFAGAIAFIGVSFYWFNPAGVGDCSFNVFIMTLTILLTLGMSAGSLHPQVQWLHPCWVWVLCAYRPLNLLATMFMSHDAFADWAKLLFARVHDCCKAFAFPTLYPGCQLHGLL